MSSREEIKALRRVIKKNKRYMQFLEMFERNPAYAINFDAFHEELQMLHMTRQTRELRRKKNSMRQFPEKVLDSMLQDQATRSRCTEIRGQCVKISSAMEKTLGNLRDYLLSEFGHHLKGIGAQAERKAFIEAIMKPFYEFLHQVQTLDKSAALIVEDIDQAGYMYTNLVKLVIVLTKPEQVSL